MILGRILGLDLIWIWSLFGVKLFALAIPNALPITIKCSSCLGQGLEEVQVQVYYPCFREIERLISVVSSTLGLIIWVVWWSGMTIFVSPSIHSWIIYLIAGFPARERKTSYYFMKNSTILLLDILPDWRFTCFLCS